MLISAHAPTKIPGDVDHDDDVDQSDFGLFQVCFSGPFFPQNDSACREARLDSDEDVDEVEVGIFLGCLSGPQVPADPNCAN